MDDCSKNERNINAFILAATDDEIDRILSCFECTSDEEQMLCDYLGHTCWREDASSRMYLFLMMCHSFREKVILASLRWNTFLHSAGFERLAQSHLNFELTPNDFVDECFKLWIITENVSPR